MCISPPVASLDALIAVVDGYCARTAEATGHAAPGMRRLVDTAHHSVSGSSADSLALAETLQTKRALINRLELDFARDAAAFAAVYEEEVLDNPSPVSWMREHCHMTSAAAASAVTVGENAARLALSTVALGEGRIGFAHLGLMAYTAEALDTSPPSVSSQSSSSAGAPFDEARLLHKAKTLSVQRFRTACGHVRHAADRDAFLAEQVEERRWRTLTLTSCGEGLEIAGFFDREAGALLRTALEPLAERSGVADQRPRPRRYGDALLELCSYSLDSGLLPRRASQRCHLQVTSTLETLLDLAGAPAAVLEHSSGLLAAASVQRLACDATITRVLLTAQSAVIDVGRSQRVVPGSTRRALNVRDQGCSWPGCERPPSRCAAHHVIHWTRQGRTDLDNLVLLCHRHHWSVHDGGWQLVRDQAGTVLTIPPTPDHVRVGGAWQAGGPVDNRTRPPTASAD